MRNEGETVQGGGRASLGERSAARPTSGREEWDRRYAATELVWTAEANRFFAREAEGLAPRSALDLATGEGRNAVWLAERGWRVRAVDFSAVAIEKAARLAAARRVAELVDFDVADLRDYEPGSECYDLVALIYLQLPRPEFAPILGRAARAVAPGGTLLWSRTIR